MQPGARVVVPEVPADEEKTNWSSVLGSVAQILAGALTIVQPASRSLGGTLRAADLDERFTGRQRFSGLRPGLLQQPAEHQVRGVANGDPNDYVKGAQFYRAEGHAGRIGIDLEKILKDSTYRGNLILFAGDSLYVPQYQPVVKVEGGVNSPVSVAYVPRRGVGYYVDRAGGFSRRAEKNRTYIVQPNGSVDPYAERVQPGARIVMPEVPAGEEKTNWGQILSGVATILTSALTIVLVVQRL